MAEAQSASLQGFSPAEAASRLTIAPSSVYRMIRSGQLKSVKVGRRTVIPASEIERLLSEGADVPTAS